MLATCGSRLCRSLAAAPALHGSRRALSLLTPVVLGHGRGGRCLLAGEPLPDDEVLLEVRAAGVGNWDEFVRTGGWGVGVTPPMALGVEAAGTVMAAGRSACATPPDPPGR